MSVFVHCKKMNYGNTVDFMRCLLRTASYSQHFLDVTHSQHTSAKTEKSLCEDQDPEGKLTAGLPTRSCPLKVCEAGGYINSQLTSDFPGNVAEIVLAGYVGKVVLKLSLN